MNVQKGMFITLEGGEGSGKTSLSLTLKEELEAKGYEVMLTREPGGVSVAENIRSVIMSEDMDDTTEALLFAAARREHLVQKVLPALEKGVIVICDRFVHSSLVYQGHVGGLGMQTVFDLNRFAIGDLMPDVTLYLDLPAGDGIARITANADREVNRFDEKVLTFHEKVREGYLSIPTVFPEHAFEKVDASGTPSEVFEASLKTLQPLLDKHNPLPLAN